MLPIPSRFETQRYTPTNHPTIQPTDQPLPRTDPATGEPLAELVVGVCSDADTLHYKGPTVMTEAERGESVRHCKWADEVVCPCPWTLDQAFLDRHAIDVVVHGEDAQVYDGGDVYAFVKAQDKFRFVKRTGGISTSDIICRLVRNHDTYLRRNFRRGYTREELNVGFLTEKIVKLEDRLEPVVTRVNDAIEKRLASWREKTEGRMESLRSTVTDAYTNVVDSFGGRKRPAQQANGSGAPGANPPAAAGDSSSSSSGGSSSSSDTTADDAARKSPKRAKK
jgi:glycerol-3-phosphate cytidylyltransferase-like family protein